MWIVKPRVSVGPVAFGSRAEDLEASLGKIDGSFKHGEDDPDTVYEYDGSQVHVTIDSEDIVKVISVFAPNEVMLLGVQILGRKLEEVVADLKASGIDGTDEGGGYWIGSVGVLLVEAEGLVDGVEVYRD